MDFPVADNSSINEQAATSAMAFRDSARAAGQSLRTLGFEVFALLLGIALACM